MSLFLHKENQNILWNLLHKSPYFIEFQQKYPNQKNEFFSQAIAAIDHEMYFKPTNVNQLVEINKEALTQMIGKLKQVLGYSSVWTQYDISSEKTRRETAATNNYNSYEEQYHELLKAPKAPSLDLNLGIKDGKLGGDMEELIKRQTELRERDIYIPPPSKQIVATMGQIGAVNVENIPRELKAISSKMSPHELPDILKPIPTKTAQPNYEKMQSSYIPTQTPTSTQIQKLKITEEEEPITVDKEFGVETEAYSPTPDGFDIRQELMDTQTHSVSGFHNAIHYQVYGETDKLHMAVASLPQLNTHVSKQVHWEDGTI